MTLRYRTLLTLVIVLFMVGWPAAVVATVDDPEIGPNDFRISDMGPDGSPIFWAFNPAVAHNPTADEYLVVWRGDDNTPPLVDGEFEIFGQRLDAATGDEIGSDFRVSDSGPDGSTSYSAFEPAVAYNSTADEYLVVWYGDDDTAPLVDNETEIFGQRLDANGAEIGSDFRVSDMGPDGNTSFVAFSPSVAYNPTTDEYLVVWEGEDDTAPLVNSEFEIFGQRIDGPSGAEVGSDFRVSDMGPNGNTSFAAQVPAVTYNPTANEYLVVWHGADDSGLLVNGETEIFGQRLTGFAAETGFNDFRISFMGPDGDQDHDAREPTVAYNQTAGEYLVVWEGDDGSGALVDNEFEIFGQRLDASTGAGVGSDFRISSMGPDGNEDFDAFNPSVAYNPTADEYLVAWWGDDDTPPLVDNETEIFGQRISNAGSQIGADDFRVSDMGPDGDPLFGAKDPAVAFNSSANEYLVAWEGTDDTGSLVDGEFEIFGQRLQFNSPPIAVNDGPFAVIAGDTISGNVLTNDTDADGDSLTATKVSEPAHGTLNLGSDGSFSYTADGNFSGDDSFTYKANDGSLDSNVASATFTVSPVAHDVGLVDTSQGIWHLRNFAGVVTTFGYGNPGDLPISGDWDGNGTSTPGLYRQSDGFFYSRNSNSTGIADAECFAGDPADVPISGDWDGDGDDNLGIYRPSEQIFYLFTTTCTGSPMGAAQISFLFGNPGDKPVAGDWDGDGIDEVGLHRESTGFFYWRNTLDTGIASGEIFFGDPADRFVGGDWGIVDGTDTPAIFRPSDLTFYFRHTLTQGVADSQFTWTGAGSGWLPVAGKFGLG